MRVYISGGITGITGYYEKFAKAENELRQLGHTPINPAAVNSMMPADLKYEEYMRMCFTMLDMADGIYMLSGWQNSCGANREYGYAAGKGKKIIFENEEDHKNVENVIL